MELLECRNLSMRYRNGPFVIRNLNMTIPAGRIIGLLGPNGCGKTTLMKMIAGLLVPTAGEIRIGGTLPGPESLGKIAYLSDRITFDPGMRVREVIGYFEDFYPDFQSGAAYSMLADLMIDPAARIRTLSKGTQEKVQLILVMSRRAALYLLDEPIAGVDPASRDYILRTILRNYDRRATILITTHLIRDVEEILDEFVFLGFGGQILSCGVADEVRRKEGKSLDELFREVFRYVPQADSL